MTMKVVKGVTGSKIPHYKTMKVNLGNELSGDPKALITKVRIVYGDGNGHFFNSMLLNY